MGKYTRSLDLTSPQEKKHSKPIKLFFGGLFTTYIHSEKKIDIESLQNRLLKDCNVPATSASLPRLLFLAAAINSTNEANKPGGTCH